MTVFAFLLLAMGVFMSVFPIKSGIVDVWYKRLVSGGTMRVEVGPSARLSQLVAPVFIGIAVLVYWLAAESPFGIKTVTTATFGAATFMSAVVAARLPVIRPLVIVFGAIALILFILT